MVGIVAFALALRLVLMLIRGDYIVFDEGYYLLLARSLRAGDSFTLNGLPHVALSPLQPVIVAGLSVIGLPDLWASRLLAAVCGALLVLPVASLASRWFGPRGGFAAGLSTAVYPALVAYLPFFPGESWNLYFGSEPLFLLLATSALAVAARAFDTGRPSLWFLAGTFADLSYLTRLEGAVVGTGLGLSLIAGYALARKPGLVRALLGFSASMVITLPYLFYLHGALGRWAVSGRVQAATTSSAAAPVAAAPSGEEGGGGAVNDFVWGGDVVKLWRTLYALDGSHTQMSSQYWGVPKRAVQPVADTTLAEPGAPVRRTSRAVSFVKAVLIVVPWIALIAAVLGGVLARPTRDALLWMTPAILTAVVPSVLAYAEPRAMLMLAPVVCVLIGGLGAEAEARLRGSGREWVARACVPIAVLFLFAPTAYQVSRAWTLQTPLQRVATSRRLVGEYFAAHLPDSARIVSWHPAVAVWARRDWRVLPYAPLDHIVTYARAQGAEAVVFSRFDPSPIANPPRAFWAILLDSASAESGSTNVREVETLPYLYVGRLGPAGTP